MEKDSYVIGRNADIQLDDSSVGRRHAELTITNGKFYLKDLGSTNGTFLVVGDSRQPFDEGYVEPNQTLDFGEFRCKVSDLIACVDVDSSVRKSLPVENREASTLGDVKFCKICAKVVPVSTLDGLPCGYCGRQA